MRLYVKSEIGSPVEALPAGHALQRMYLEMRVEGGVGQLVHFAGRTDEVLPSTFRFLLDQTLDLRLGVLHVV